MGLVDGPRVGRQEVERILLLEQSLLDRSRDARVLLADADLSLHRRYLPEGRSSFQVQAYWIDDSLVRAWSSPRGNETCWRRRKSGRLQWLLFVHPQSIQHYRPLLQDPGVEPHEGARFFASPMSSARTVLAWQEDALGSAFCLKLSLDTTIGAVPRTIRNERVPKCVGITSLFDGALADLPTSFAYHGEGHGLAPVGMKRGGMLVRDVRAQPSRPGASGIPLFALWSRARARPVPLLLRMSRALAMEPRQFLRDSLITPFARQWCHLAIRSGVVTEPHAQNLLLEVDEKGSPTGRLIHRDLEDVSVDLAWRERRQLFVPESMPHLRSIGRDYQQRKHRWWLRSSIATFFIGGVLQPLETLLASVDARQHEGGFLRKDLVRALSLELAEIQGYGRQPLYGSDLGRFDDIVMRARVAIGRTSR